MSDYLREIVSAGGRVFEVGGCVRDRLMGRPSKDTDYLVCGLPMDDLVRTLSRHGRVNLVGKSFGVLKFTRKGETVDIALPRKEVSTGVGHRDFDIQADPHIPLEVDLGRRDFTLNAIARDAITGEIADPYGGQRDIAAQVLRMVHPRAFEEDPLRMLRGIQFAGRFRFRIEPETLEAVRRNRHLVTSVSPERISTELVKLLRSAKPSHGFRMMHELGLLALVLPELAALDGLAQPPEHHVHDVLQHSLEACDRVPWKGRVYLRLAALFHDLGKKETFSRDDGGHIHFYGHAEVSARHAETILTRLKFTAVEDVAIPVDHVVRLVDDHMFGATAEHPDRTIRRFISKIGKGRVMDQIRLRIGDRLASRSTDAAPWIALARRIRRLSAPGRGGAFTLKDLAVGGNDLMQAGIPRGPLLGKLLAQLLDRVLVDPALNEKATLLALLPELRQILEDPARASAGESSGECGECG